MHAFPSANSLRLRSLNFEDLPHLVDFVGFFSQLTNLVVDIGAASHAYADEAQEPYVDPQTPSPLLKHDTYSSGPDFCFWWRALSPSPQSLMTVPYDVLERPYIGVRRLAAAACQELER